VISMMETSKIFCCINECGGLHLFFSRFHDIREPLMLPAVAFNCLEYPGCRGKCMESLSNLDTSSNESEYCVQGTI
jgi:hypothetical protein